MEKIKLYKKAFREQLEGENDRTTYLNKLYTEILEVLKSKYKNTYSLLDSSLIFYLFLIPEDQLIRKTANDLKKLFLMANIVENSQANETNQENELSQENESFEIKEGIYERTLIFNYVTINTNVNLLEYHPLVLKHQEDKEKIIKKILNKLVLALKMDIFKGNSFVDFLKSIEESLIKQVPEKKTNTIKNKTSRGGIKKKIKTFKGKFF